jgi:hypothetical protein
VAEDCGIAGHRNRQTGKAGYLAKHLAVFYFCTVIQERMIQVAITGERSEAINEASKTRNRAPITCDRLQRANQANTIQPISLQLMMSHFFDMG